MEPYRIEISDEDLRDLHERLHRTRWPERETVDDWSQGVPLAYLQELCGYWAGGYDWRATERRLNALPQFRTEIDGVGIHVVHVRSPHSHALPLLLTNGWPGSIVEYLKVIGPLTDPAAHGGDAADAFHVVCPTLPGYGFSDKPAGPGWGVDRIAGAWAELMSRLGYDRYAAAGSDWGTSVTTRLGLRAPESVVGIHLMPPLAPPDPATFGNLTDSERAALESLREADEWGSGYSMQQSTRPQTVGYGLVDSPVALCAWIVEKFWAWTDWDTHLDEIVTRDELLANVTLYWLSRTGASSARLYWESIRQVNEWIAGSAGEPVTVPTGCTIFPKELQRPSRRWAEKRFPNILHWGETARGGHFAALEQPELFVDELRSFFRLVR
ncbi:epoxide hydrolase [Phytoactinopolyspora halotolerans]|uniref:Epoxide hydrolase n=2 Tax=Phytoactinopolyspora halotolerans TaxID=1981512 RepID=A0A6L9SD74_9ACTN|nr:epoxide hydrolase [Phytoactinopolyspora halotolerans]